MKRERRAVTVVAIALLAFLGATPAMALPGETALQIEGQTRAANALVSVFAWQPVSKDLPKEATGEIERPLVSVGVTDSNGDYVLTIPAPDAKFIDPDGYFATYQVVLTASGKEYTSQQSFPVGAKSKSIAAFQMTDVLGPLPTTAATTQQVSEVDGVSPVARQAVGPIGAFTGLSVSDQQQMKSAVMSSGKQSIDASVFQPMDCCCVGPTYGAAIGPYRETFLFMYASTQAFARMELATSNVHTLGIAVQVGAGTTWTAGGSASKTSGWAWDTGFTKWKSSVALSWYYRDEIYSCTTGGTTYTTTYRQPYAFESGPYFTDVRTVPNYTYCLPATAGTSPSRTGGTNEVVVGGIALPGVTVNAQSGYSTSMKESWHFTVNGQMCGSNSAWNTAGRVESKTP